MDKMTVLELTIIQREGRKGGTLLYNIPLVKRERIHKISIEGNPAVSSMDKDMAPPLSKN